MIRREIPKSESAPKYGQLHAPHRERVSEPIHYCVTEGPEAPGDYLVSLVDDVILPLVRA